MNQMPYPPLPTQQGGYHVQSPKLSYKASNAIRLILLLLLTVFLFIPASVSRHYHGPVTTYGYYTGTTSSHATGSSYITYSNHTRTLSIVEMMDFYGDEVIPFAVLMMLCMAIGILYTFLRLTKVVKREHTRLSIFLAAAQLLFSFILIILCEEAYDYWLQYSYSVEPLFVVFVILTFLHLMLTIAFAAIQRRSTTVYPMAQMPYGAPYGYRGPQPYYGYPQSGQQPYGQQARPFAPPQQPQRPFAPTQQQSRPFAPTQQPSAQPQQSFTRPEQPFVQPEKPYTSSEQTAQKSKPATVSPVEEIRKYKELLDIGAITEEDFEAKKKQLLGI